MTNDFQREYLLRLPLPLAQLYGRAHNAKDARARHDNTFYLFEALIKLAAAPAIAAYLAEAAHGGQRSAPLDKLLTTLALPSLGQWLNMLRELARHFGTRVDAATHPLGHLWQQLNTAHRDLPAALALYQQIKNGPDGAAAGDQSVSLLQLLDALVLYRNTVFGHGGPRLAEFYEHQMGPLLFPAANQVLADGVCHWLGVPGTRLIYLTELRATAADQFELGLRELVGTSSERAAPLTLTAAQSQGLVPNRVAVLWPGRKTPLPLDPLLAFRESEMAEEVLFLNRDRNSRQVEYLSYTTGRTERDREMLPAMARLLSQVTARSVTADDVERFQRQSLAETPSFEALSPSESPAVQIQGDYEILAEIGRGGMGVVYLARQHSLGRLVALKMLPADLAADEVALARFRREMRSLARCDHPNIVKVLASGTLPDGQLFYAMEYVPGADLEHVWRELSGSHRQGDASTLGTSTWAQAVLSAAKKQRDSTFLKNHSTSRPGTLAPRPLGEGRAEGDPATDPPRETPVAPDTLPLPPLPELPNIADDPGGYARRVAMLVRDAALALQAVHDQGITHRDVKPANLMLTPDGSRVVLMDFGLAKGQSLALTRTGAGGFLGTLRYAAPEQLAAATLTIGPTADVRSLGAVLWELLTRRRLFDDAEDEVQLAHRVHEQDVPRLRSIDRALNIDLEAIVARATERRIVERIATAADLARYLQMFLDGKPLPIRPPSLVELSRRWVREHTAFVSSALVVCVAILAVAYFLIVAAETRRVAAISREINEGLRQSEWPPGHTEKIESLLGELSLSADDEAIHLRRQLHETFANRMHDSLLGRPTISDKDLAEFESDLRWLESREAARVPELTQQLERRLRSWEEVFHMRAPFDNWRRIFPHAVVDIQGGRLHRNDTVGANTHSVVSSVSSMGNVRLAVVFDTGWMASNELGVLLHSDDTRGYEFRLSVPAPETVEFKASPKERRFASLVADGDVVTAEIKRDGQVLRQALFPAANLADPALGTLTLEATVEGNQVTFKVAKLPPLKFEDTFPNPGGPRSHFGILWPRGVPVISLKAARQALAVTPSPLEQGDELFSHEQWDAAIVLYRHQADKTPDKFVRQEARFKEALCLARLSREEEAIQIWEQLALSDNERLQILAASQLWLLMVRQEKFDEAQHILENLQSRFQFSDLAILVPEADRKSILHGIYRATSGINLLKFGDTDLEFLKRAYEASMLLDPSASREVRNSRAWQLLRAYHVCGENDAALRFAHGYFGSNSDPPYNMIEETSWILRQEGEYEEAYALLNRYISAEESKRHFLALLVERSRIHAATERWDEAARDLDQFLTLHEFERHYVHTNACLVRGFLHRRSGNESAAKEIWQRGADYARSSTPNGTRAITAILLGALTEELTDEHFEELMSYQLSTDWGGVSGEIFKQYIPLMLPAARRMAGSEFGLEVVRRIAFQEMSLQEYMRAPVALMFLELTRQGAAPSDWNDDETIIMYQLVHDGMEEYQQKRLSNTHVVQFMLTWKGANNAFGWKTLAPAVPAHVRASAAYIFGHRYRKLDKRDDAEEFFRAALSDAKEESPLARLAKQQLDQLRLSNEDDP